LFIKGVSKKSSSDCKCGESHINIYVLLALKFGLQEALTSQLQEQ
jgi:hypothetical protein